MTTSRRVWIGVAVVVGSAQYLSLPSATDPRPIWIVLPLIAAVSAVAGLLLALRGMRFAADAAMLLVGVELAVWGFVKRDGLGAAIVPTDAPLWLDRFTTALEVFYLQTRFQGYHSWGARISFGLLDVLGEGGGS